MDIMPASGAGLIINAIAGPGDLLIIDGGEVVKASLRGENRGVFAVHKRVGQPGHRRQDAGMSQRHVR